MPGLRWTVDQQSLHFREAHLLAGRRRQRASGRRQFGPGLPGRWRLDRGDTAKHFAELLDALSGRRDNRAYRHTAESLCEAVDVDAQTTELSGIGHGQSDDQRTLQLEQLLYEVKTLVQAGRVDNGENAVRRRCPFHVAQDDVDRYLLLERMRAERVRAGQVNEFERALPDLQGADMTLDRNARVVANALPQPGQPIEERALARIGITDNRNAGVGSPA